MKWIALQIALGTRWIGNPFSKTLSIVLNRNILTLGVHNSRDYAFRISLDRVDLSKRVLDSYYFALIVIRKQR
ncbi:hypothetical protein D3C84_936670 [compost metagenome]